MSKLTIITDRALELVNQAGSSLKHAVPNADKLLQTGAALTVAKTGARTAGRFIRKNPVIAVAAAAGLGLLAFAAYRKRKRDAANAPLEGKSRRIEARKVNGAGKTTRDRTTARKSPSTSSSASTE